MCFVCTSTFFLFRQCIISRVLGFGARRGAVSTHGACVGPGRGPWHVLWVYIVARNHGEAFRAHRAIRPVQTREQVGNRDAHLLTRYPTFSRKQPFSDFPIFPHYLLSFEGKRRRFGGGQRQTSSPGGPCTTLSTILRFV